MEKSGGILREVNVGEGEQGQGERSPCCCQEEIKSLKRTVEQLSVQIGKQSEVFQRKQDEMIAGMKTCVRNVALALLTFSQENENDGDGRHGNPEQASGPATVDTELLTNSEVAMSSAIRRSSAQDNLQDGKAVSPVTNLDDVPVIVSSVSLENSSNEQIGLNVEDTVDHVGDDGENDDFQENQDQVEAGPVFCQKFEVESDVNFEDELGDSFYDLDENEDEANHEKEDEEKSCHEASSSSSTATKVKGKGDFQKQPVRHKKRKQSADRSKCHLCTKDFPSRYSLKVHIRSVHEGVRHKCTKCPGTFSSKTNVQKHERRVHRIGGPPTQQCQICGIHLPNSEQSLINHIKCRHKVGGRGGISREKCECSKCPAKFSRLEHLQQHENRVHLEGRPTQKCKLCGVYLVDSKGSLQGHMNKKHSNWGCKVA